MRMLRLSNLIIVVLAVSWAAAASRLVPDEYANIQAAIDDCNDGDVVIVADGVYTGVGNGGIDFQGKAITVQSLNGPGGCTIDCGLEGRGFHFHSSEDANSVVSGFTVTRSYTFDYGGGILCEQSSPTISNCIFLQNIATRGGGVANMNESHSRIINCVFTGNSAAYGGGVHNSYSSPDLTNCTFFGNIGASGSGGIDNHGDPTNPTAYRPVITNCVIRANSSRDLRDHEVQLGIYDSSPIIAYCCIQDWTDALPGTNNLYSDPLLFTDNYHLTAESPCIDAGDPNPDHITSTDIDGQIRIGNGRVDMGADEFHAGTTIIIVEPTRFDLSYNFGDPPVEPQILSVSSGLDGYVRWEVAQSCDWLEVSPDSGESSGEIDEVVITIQPNGLAAGAHSCILAVSDPNGVNSPQHVIVTLDIERPIIGVYPATVDVTLGRDDPNPKSFTLSIRNENVGVLNWRISTESDLLTPWPEAGSSSGDANEVVVGVDANGLDYGEYVYYLTIDDPNAVNSPQYALVRVHVVRPQIEFTPDEFEFSYAAGHIGTAKTLFVSNGSEGLLNWRITCDCNWLEIEPNSGVSQQYSNAVTLRPDTSGLAPGDYACTVTVADTNASNTPQTLPVTLHVFPSVLNVPGDFTTIQQAIDSAGEGAEVVVQPGTYTGPGNYRIYFRGKAITVRSIDPNDPNIIAATIVDCNLWGAGFIFAEDEDASSILSGFTIVNSMYSGRSGGPAIGCYDSSPVITNCIITRNSGGGIHVIGGEPAIRNCTIVNNSKDYFGGGIYVDYESFATIEKCIISGNSAYYGGGIYCSRSSVLVVRNSSIIGNKADYFGGGFCCEGGDVVISACTIAGNAAEERGGGIYSTDSSTTVSDSILWGNYAPADAEISGDCAVRYSSVEGGWPGEGNIDADPCFAAAGYWGHIDDPNIHVEPNDPDGTWVDGDYHLKSEYGRWEPNIKVWVFDEVTSLCIDGADPNLDWSAELWPHGERVNLGVYGGTSQASMSPNDVGNVADMDLDGFVYRTDLPLLLGAWLSDAVPLREDLTRDGIVNFPDFSVFARNYKRPALPAQAEIVSPLDGTLAVSRTPALSWLSDANALWHDVYLGTESPGIMQSRISATTFEPDVLARSTWYYWRIDEMNPAGITAGEVWSFQTGSSPDRASNPEPGDGEVETSIYPLLSWDSGDGATSHDVYFGTTSPIEFQGNQVETTFDPSYLLHATTYYWRIDEVNDVGTTTGAVWSLTTTTSSR